jgi:hypothetical protein
MKRNIWILAPALLAIMVFLACKKQYTLVAQGETAGSSAFLKIVHASPNFDSIFHTGFDSLNVYFGQDKITATALTYGTGFPTPTSTIYTLTYVTVPSGAQDIRISLAGTGTKDSSTVVTLHKVLNPGAYYTLVITDSINSTRDSNRIWLQDNFPRPGAGPGYFYLRFMNAVQDARTDTVDLFSVRRNQTLFKKVKVDSTTSFTNFATILNVADTLVVLRTGTGTVLAKMTTPNIQFGDQQFYTAYYVGDTAAAVKKRILLINQNK